MESIGELARRTGTTPRMLRHWEAAGLVAPTHVDPFSGRRRYAASQAGRVRAIAALRSIGFGLEAIGDLFDQGLTQSRLEEILRAREAELAAQIVDASTALREVQRRLRSITRERNTIMDALKITELPELKLNGSRETVAHESEISDAVDRLLERLGTEKSANDDAELVYDGETDAAQIAVFAGFARADGGDASLDIPAVQGAVVRFDHALSSTADAWVALDAELETRGLRTTGPYRQTLHADGDVTLSAPVQER